MASDKYTTETITSVRVWTPKLFSVRTTRHPDYRFTPGQFARLGLRRADAQAKDGSGWSTVWRAYSMASGRDESELEFYSIVVPGGEFSTEFARLGVGDSLLVDTTAYGFLTTDRFQTGQPDGHDLWLISTGTGLAPFVSILLDPKTWTDYQRLIVVHSVHAAQELVYREEIEKLASGPLYQRGGAQLLYLPVVTGTALPGVLGARIGQLLETGQLEAAAVPLDLQRSRIMLCGNPDMVSSSRKLLAARGFTTSRRNAPGQLAVENYW